MRKDLTFHDLMSVKQAAKLLGITTTALRERIKAGKIETIRVGDYNLFLDRQDVARMKKEQP